MTITQQPAKVEVLRPNQLAGLDVVSVSDLEITMNLLIYGDSGVGKTVLAGSSCLVPEMAPVLVLDIEGGTLSLRKKYPEVDMVRIKSWAHLVSVYDGLKKAGPDGYYKTVVLDSLTECQKVSMSAIMRRVVEANNERDPDLPGIGEWGKNTNQVRALVRLFRDLPMNVIFTCLAAREQDNKANWHTKLGLTNKLASEIPGFMDVVLYMYTQEQSKEDGGGTLRLLLSTRTKGVMAKDRTDKLPPVIGGPDTGPPTMKLLHEIMFGKQTSQSINQAAN